MKNCNLCPFEKTHYQKVVGRGTTPCEFLFIGDYPAIEDDLCGSAFVDNAGLLLDVMRKEAKIDRVPSYFTNCMLCRPCEKKGGDSRTPTKVEILRCALNVTEIIIKAKPKKVIDGGYFGKISERLCW
jgi:uracil-DNA glycosylase family 4